MTRRARRIEKLLPLAEAGDRQAQHKLGKAYYVPPSAKRFSWLVKLLTGGPSERQTTERADAAEAARWLHKAAEHGLTEAQLDLGIMYSEGEGIPKDEAEAVKWLHMASRDLAAKAILGQCYQEGSGVQQDYVQAYLWYSLAQEQMRAEAEIEDPLLKDALKEITAKMTADQVAEAQRLVQESKQEAFAIPT